MELPELELGETIVEKPEEVAEVGEAEVALLDPTTELDVEEDTGALLDAEDI